MEVPLVTSPYCMPCICTGTKYWLPKEVISQRYAQTDAEPLIGYKSYGDVQVSTINICIVSFKMQTLLFLLSI